MRVGGAVLVAFFAVSMAAAGQGDVLRLTSPHAELTGVYDLEATASAAWFLRDGSEGAAGLLPVFTIRAPSLVLTNRTYVGQATVTTAGLPVVEGEPRSIEETSRFAAATVEAIDIHPHAELRLAGAPEATVAARFSQGGSVYADAAKAPEYQRPHADVYDDESALARFHQTPEGTPVFRSGPASMEAAGPFEVLVRGVDLRVTDDQGRANDFMASPTSVPASHGPVRAEASTWTDFVLAVPPGAELVVIWNSQVDLFATSASVAGHGSARFESAWGVAPGLAEDVRLEGQTHTHEGPLSAAAEAHSGAAEGAMVAWTFTASAAPEPSAGPVDGTGGLVEAWWWLVLIVGLPVSAVRAAFWMRSRSRPEPVVSRPTKKAADAVAQASASQQGLALFNQGRIGQALPHLEQDVRERPKDPDVRYALGVALAKAGRVAEALSHMEFAIRQDATFLGLLVTDEDTRSFRHAPAVAAFVRRMARRFHDDDMRGYV